ncbi:MAG: OmpA family protein [Smithella sp.]
MKKIFMLTVVLMVIAFVTTAQAEEVAGSFSFTPYIGGYLFDKKQDVSNAPVYGISLGYNFTKYFGVEASGEYIATKYDLPLSDSQSTNVGNYRLDGILNLIPDSRLVPFIFVGLGAQTIDYPKDVPNSRSAAVDFGAGFNFFITDGLALRADIRDIYRFDVDYMSEGSTLNNFEYTLGLSFYFGGQKKAVVAQNFTPPIEAPQPPPPPPVVEQKVEAPPPPPPPIVEQKVEAPPPPPPPVQEKVTIALNVEFDTAKAVVKEKYHDKIKRVADFMKEHPETNALIEGYTDNVGKEVSNQKLSEERANSVRQYIIDKFGIDGSRLTAIGYDSNKPIASNDTKEGRQKNRRVQAVLEAMRTIN